MRSTLPIKPLKQNPEVCREDGFSLLPVDGSIPSKGTIQAALEAAEMLPDLSDADFDDLEKFMSCR